MTKYDIAANIAFFLLEKTGSTNGVWRGRMTANQQRSLFGSFLGKGQLVINGENETIRHYIKVCFGLDFDCNKEIIIAAA